MSAILFSSKDHPEYHFIETVLRPEFERQHTGRNLKRHRLRGTYFQANIAMLWVQHVRTALWMKETYK